MVTVTHYAILIAFIFHTIYAQHIVCTDINASFPINLDNKECHGLYNVTNINTYQDCAQACCAKPGCEVFQFCPTGSTCGAAPRCMIGGADWCLNSYAPGWQSRARVEPPTSHIWPLPYEYSFSSYANIYVDAYNFQFILSSQSSDIMNQAIIRYKSLTFPSVPEDQYNYASPKISSLQIDINDYSENTLQYGMDESYNLTMSNSTTTAILSANTIWGGLRGLETFSQLVIFNYTNLYYNTWDAVIVDKPRFGHRGIMIDTSRHFLSVPVIKSVIDSLAYAKFNTLHWHVTDAQSFPMESRLYPKLWEGSWTYIKVYTK